MRHYTARNGEIIGVNLQENQVRAVVRTYAKNKAPLFASVPFWRNILFVRRAACQVSPLIAGDHTRLYAPEMIATDKTFEARSKCSIPKIETQLHRLVDWTITVAEVRALRVTKVDVETLFRAREREARIFLDESRALYAVT